ncbi:MAG: hypothetical protein P4M15_09350 [Alphaproteobacteria bacterium]|nr:hypothetical protein [Alphaproteobacteria bacterium]
MRVWEVDDNREIPSDLVREQDFILRVRRMQRNGAPTIVLNLILTAIAHLAKSRSALEAVHEKLQAFAKASGGFYSDMSNGDIFIAWDETPDTRGLGSRIVEAILPDHKADTAQFLLTYHMPRDYALLRERTNHYVEVVRAAATMSLGGEGRVEDTRGPLTTKNVDQIGNLLGEIDLRRYARTQNIYRAAGQGWEMAGEEYFISFEDLRRERFPKLELPTTEHFFLALCGILDQRLLAMLTTTYELIGGRRINLNLSVASIMGGVFAQFVRRVPQEHRPLIGFELHRGDLFQDFSLTLSAIDVLKREGFRVALDAVTPDMATYLDLGAFKVDSIKINVSKDRVLQLADPVIRRQLEKLPVEKLIFFRCDNERALAIGREMKVGLFQGWLIDDLAGKKPQK